MISFPLLLLLNSNLASQDEAKLELDIKVAKIDSPVEKNILFIGYEGKIDKKEMSLGSYLGKSNLVLFFFNEACGVTFSYKDRVAALQKKFEPKNFKFLGIHCGRQVDPTQPLVIGEVNLFKMSFFIDKQNMFLKHFSVNQSVSFAVIDQKGILRYRGGFDDNANPKLVKNSYLAKALTSISTGKKIVLKKTSVLGCAILP